MGSMDYIDLFRALSNSDVILKPSLGTRNLVFTIGAGCVFIGPEDNQSLDIIIDANRPGSKYRIREVKQEGHDNETVVRLFGVDNFVYALHRSPSDLPDYEFHEFPWEMYEEIGIK
jgi:hypothetical protein